MCGFVSKTSLGLYTVMESAQLYWHSNSGFPRIQLGLSWTRAFVEIP